MHILHSLQERFGFTRSEINVIMFLSGTLLAGIMIKYVFSPTNPATAAAFDYTQADSEYAARAHALSALAPARPSDSSRTHHAAPKASPAPGGIDINAADVSQLVRLPGIGPSYAGRIIAYRAEHGKFANAEELLEVKGIGPKRLERLKPYIVVR